MKKLVLLMCLLALAASSKIQAQLPAVTLKTIDGKSVKMDTLNNAGKPIIMSFFGTFCKPCMRELDAIAEVYDEWQEETGVRLVLVSIDRAQDVQKVKPLVANHGWSYEVFLDTNEELKRALGCQMVPFVVILDGQGKVVYKHSGYTDGGEQELIEKVRELVEK